MLWDGKSRTLFSASVLVSVCEVTEYADIKRALFLSQTRTTTSAQTSSWAAVGCFMFEAFCMPLLDASYFSDMAQSDKVRVYY